MSEGLPLFGILLSVLGIFLTESLQRLYDLGPIIPHLIHEKTEDK